MQDNCNDQSECENLTLTLYKGGIELAMQEFPAMIIMEMMILNLEISMLIGI